jgi:hypothetical protein
MIHEPIASQLKVDHQLETHSGIVRERSKIIPSSSSTAWKVKKISAKVNLPIDI